jgi:predicted CoA-substrate-specific enzyme activase
VDCEVVVPERPEMIDAYGAATYACNHKLDENPDFSKLNIEQSDKEQAKKMLRDPLELKLSKYPDVKYHDYYVDEKGSEIALVEERTGDIAVTLGIDIGSTSTKATLLDFENKVVAWIYRKTAGDPIGAVQKLLDAVRNLSSRSGINFDIKAVGTTGSGRKMIKEVIGADIAVNEITAHARAAVFLDPEVDTILELGGQDAKFTQLQNGVVYNSIMNYVCAAGTGSFIEEQALKLGVPIAEYADFAMGLECPKTSDRCTVYMERDLDLLLAKGWSKKAVAASVLHSVRDNYLNKVVGGLYIGNHVCFQGATARNKALVAAFEYELGVPVKVSPYCHVTGALGMCLLAKERFEGVSGFKGLGFADSKISIEYETCELCHNRCNLSIIKTDGATVAWGLKCGRDYEADKPVFKKNTGFDFLKKRNAAWQKDINAVKEGVTIGIPRSLGTYGYVPMWRTFFQELGCKTVLSSRSTESTLKTGVNLSTAEYCAPVAMSHGHIYNLINKDKVDYVFLPYMLREKNEHKFTDAHFCCYLQAHPGVIESNDGIDTKGKLISPIVQFNIGENYMLDRLEETVGKTLGKSRQQLISAYRKGLQAQEDFKKECSALGLEGLQQIKDDGNIGIVILGRPYNAMDPGMALDLPRKIAEMGYNVLYLDMLPLDYANIEREHPNMYWNYGQKILAAADYILQNDNLFGVYFTNFMCGPDSYIQTYFKEMMGRKKKPYITLQFDGHGADAGYLTRIEAALESFHSWRGVPRPHQESEGRNISNSPEPVEA